MKLPDDLDRPSIDEMLEPRGPEGSALRPARHRLTAAASARGSTTA
jgi:hypothetical protein